MLTIDAGQENDGRWIGEVTALPGGMAYWATEAEARQKAAILASRVIAGRVQLGEAVLEAVGSGPAAWRLADHMCHENAAMLPAGAHTDRSRKSSEVLA